MDFTKTILNGFKFWVENKFTKVEKDLEKYANSKIDEDKLPNTVPAVQSATVGQAVVVKTTDENGKPIEWEAANVQDLNIVTPQMYGWVKGEDVGVVINQIFADGKSVYLPNGTYGINTTVELTGAYRGNSNGLSIEGDVETIVYPMSNIDLFHIKGSNSTLKNLRMDLEKCKGYDATAITFTTSTQDSPCFANTIQNVTIWDADTNNPSGIGIKFDINGNGFAYLNVIDNVQLYNLDNGVLFVGDTTMGINANNLTNLQIWRCAVGILCESAINGTTITGCGQVGEAQERYSSTDGYAFITLQGNYNRVDMVVFDCGVNGCMEYGYSLLDKSCHNIITHSNRKNTIKNDVYNVYGIHNENLPIVPSINASNKDYSSDAPYPLFKVSDPAYIWDFNNILNSEFVSNVSFAITSGTASKFGNSIDFTNENELRKLSKINNPLGLILRGNVVDEPYTCELTYTFDNATDQNVGNIEYVAVQSTGIFQGLYKESCVVEVIANYYDGSSVILSPVNAPMGVQLAPTRLFQVKDKSVITSGGVTSLVIRFSFIGGATNDLTLGISKIMATFKRNPWARGNIAPMTGGVADRSGDIFFGDIEFTNGKGIVFFTSNGDKFRLAVDDSGTLTTTKIT